MKIKKIIRKAHRWIGLSAAIWLLLLATTGLLLQHSADWGLDNKHITNETVLKAYGIGKQYIAFKQDEQLLQQVDKQLIQDHKITIKLSENLTSAIYQKPNWIVVTKTQIHWINQTGQIVQSMDEIDGLTLPVLDIGLLNNQAIIKTKNSILHLKTLKPINESSQPKWSNPLTDINVKRQAIKQTSQKYISYQQAVFDLHAGITTSKLINDIAAVALIILSLSGIFLFFRKNKRSNLQQN